MTEGPRTITPGDVPVHEISVHKIADAAVAVPGVSGLSGGPLGVVATYLPGERVEGVAVRDDEVEVDIVAEYGVPLRPLADEVRAAVAPLCADRPVNVVVADLALPDPAAPDPAPDGEGEP